MRTKVLVVLSAATAIVAVSASLLDVASAQPKTVPTADAGVGPARAAFIDNAAKGLVVPPKLEEVERMCGLLVGCRDTAMPPLASDFGSCVRELWSGMAAPETVKFSLTVRECASAARTCDDLRLCALRGAAPDRCAQRALDTDAPVGFCDADGRAVMCWRGKVHSVRDCPRGGEQCAIRDGRAACVLGQCDLDAGSGQSTCSPNGQRVLFCEGGKLASTNCAAFGLQCLTDAGKAGCGPAQSPACTGTASRCDGNTAVGCVQGHEVRVECDKGDMTCATSSASANQVGACAVPQPEAVSACDPKTWQSRCVGTNVAYCAAGVQRQYSCRKAPFTRCAGQPGSAHCE